MEKSRESRRNQGQRFAIVDKDALIRFLSREEFDLIKKFNANFMEMRAGDFVYLTELPPEISQR